MSDGEGGAPAPVESAPTGEAPEQAEGGAPVEAKPPPKARTIDDDLEDVLKKHGGYKYKAGGGEKSVTAAKDLRQMLSRVSGIDSAASEAMKAKQEADSVKNQVAQLAKMKPNERIKALAGMGIDPKAIREAFEEEILADDERTKQQAHLTPRERQMQEELEHHKGELAKYEEGKKRWEAEQEELAYVERVTQTGERLTKATVGALQKAKITGEHAPHFLNAIADRLDRNERLGLGLDEDELAEAVVKEHETLADQYYGGLDVGALAEKLEGMPIDDPDKPGAKTTRLKLLMRHEAAKIRARQNGGGSPPVRATVSGAAPGGDSVADKLGFWRR